MTRLGFFSSIAHSFLKITGCKIHGLFIYSTNIYWTPNINMSDMVIDVRDSTDNKEECGFYPQGIYNVLGR